MTGGRGCHPPAPPISALPHRLPPGGSYCGMFRGEPAIPGLDWTFTPRRGSGERFAHQHPCGPPRVFRPASPCPRLDRPASGRTAGTIGRAHPAPRPKACGPFGFPSASGFQPLASPLPYTPWPVFQNVRSDPGMPALVLAPRGAFLRAGCLSGHCSLSPAGFRLFSLPFSGFFSAFGHPTSALSDSGRI